MKAGKWDARIRRASDLAARYPFAAEGLHFYGHIAQFQKSLYFHLQRQVGTAHVFRELGTLRQELDLFLLLGEFEPFLAVVEQRAPVPLAQSARAFRAAGPPRWQDALASFWSADPAARAALSSPDALLAWIFLQPYAEYLADHAHHPPVVGTPPICPLCLSLPQAGVLRPEGDGAKRMLLCSLCATEWEFRRIVCASCGQEDVHKLAVFTTDKFPCVRVEACDLCRHYLKTVDLTRDGHAVPVVDELATIPLTLWAAEHGYEKLSNNILGL